jgi:hypothetical protein
MIPLVRQSFGKIITLLIAISLLTAGLAPANPRCTADCCMKPKIHGSHSKIKVVPADLVADCCSGLETAPCPHTLESSSEFKDYALSAVAPDVRSATVTIAGSSNNKFILPQSRSPLAPITSPQIRGPGVPIYLLTETFLI